MIVRKICAALMMTVCGSLSAATINVFLLGGQSNMDGRADATLLTNNFLSQTDVLFYSNSAGNTLTTLKPRTDNQFGPEITFGRAMADYYSSDPTQQVALVKNAVGGTNLYSQWAADGTSGSANDGSNYKSFQSTVTNALNALRAAHPGEAIVIRGMIWMQGESDAVATYSVQYQANLANFINDIRLTYGADLPFVIGGLSNYQTSLNTTYRNDVRAGQEAVADGDPLTGIVNTNGFQLKSDNLHWDAIGQQQLGEAFALEMQKYLLIPEPATYGLLGLGLLAVAVLRKFRHPQRV